MRRTDWLQLSVHALWFAALPFANLPVLAVLSFWNYAVLHNHMHLPIVSRGRFLVSRTLAFACGFPYRAYHLHHANHHRYDDGPGDYGIARPGESVTLYIARQLVATWLWPVPSLRRLFRDGKTRAQRAELIGDVVTHFAATGALLVWAPHVVGAWVVAQAGVFYLNLAAHEDGPAVTSTSWFYNTFFFNAGYHGAHHHRPHLAWQKLPEIAVDGPRSDLSPINPVYALQVARRRRTSKGHAVVAS